LRLQVLKGNMSAPGTLEATAEAQIALSKDATKKHEE
jgi:hypothetical protein